MKYLHHSANEFQTSFIKFETLDKDLTGKNPTFEDVDKVDQADQAEEVLEANNEAMEGRMALLEGALAPGLNHNKPDIEEKVAKNSAPKTKKQAGVKSLNPQEPETELEATLREDLVQTNESAENDIESANKAKTTNEELVVAQVDAALETQVAGGQNEVAEGNNENRNAREA